MEENTQDNGKMGLCTDLGCFIEKMGKGMKEDGLTGKNTEKGTL